MLPTDTKLCCNILGIATNKIFLSISNENNFDLPQFSLRILKTNVTKDNIDAIPCAINVAQATPETPNDVYFTSI